MVNDEKLQKLEFFFSSSKGNLAEIQIKNNQKDKLIKLFIVLLSISKNLSEEVTVWDNDLNRDVKCIDFKDKEELFNKLLINATSVSLELRVDLK